MSYTKRQIEEYQRIIIGIMKHGAFIPGVQCIWERDLDETALCKMQQPRVPSGSCVGASAPSPTGIVPKKERE